MVNKAQVNKVRQKFDQNVEKSLRNCFAPGLDQEAHDGYLQTALFADGNDIPDHWRTGWHIATANGQSGATRRTDPKNWWRSGGKPILLLHGAQDAVAPAKDTSEPMKKAFGDQITIIEVEKCGHAMLPEQPELISEHIIDFIKIHKAK